MKAVSVTDDIFQVLTSISNDDAPRNILLMVVTPDTSHPDRSSLNVSLNWNKFDISVTRETHHDPMGHPYVSWTFRQASLPWLSGSAQASTAS